MLESKTLSIYYIFIMYLLCIYFAFIMYLLCIHFVFIMYKLGTTVGLMLKMN